MKRSLLILVLLISFAASAQYKIRSVATYTGIRDTLWTKNNIDSIYRSSGGVYTVVGPLLIRYFYSIIYIDGLQDSLSSKMNFTDTLNMLSPYRIGLISVAGKVNISDTANMLSHYLTGLVAIPTKVKYTDTANMLSAYLNSIIANTSAITGKATAIVVAADATDADFSIAINSIKYLPAATISQNRTITFPAGSNGDYIEIYNNEAGFTWLLAGGSVYRSDGTTVVGSLLANTNYIIRKVSSKWRILN